MKRKCVVFLLLVFLLFQYSCFNDPEENQWKILGLEGMSILQLKESHSYLYACTGSDGLWRKNIERSSSQWEYLGMADSSFAENSYLGVQDVVVNSDNANELLIIFNEDSCHKHSIYKSIDNGDNWFSSDSGLEYYYAGKTYYISLDAILYYSDYVLGAGGSVYELENFGDVWIETSQQAGAQNCILKRNNQEQNIIWLGGNNATFSPTLASSNNGGRSWNNLSLQIGGYNIVQFGTVTDIAFHSQDINTVYVSLSDKLLKTSNSGYTWTVQCDTACCVKMITDPEDGDHLWGCEGAKIKESFDAGVTWQELDTSIDSLIWDMLLVEERNHLYIGTKNGVHSYKLP